jgi:hypothetical protein
MLRENEITEILARVDTWLPEDRVALAYQILRDMRNKPLPDPPRNTLDVALGIGRGENPVPTDSEVDQIMAEHRLRKYG